MQERRASPRLRIRHKVGVMLSGGDVLHVWTYDMSQGGMQLLSEYNADTGDTLRVFLDILDATTDEYVRVYARVRVAHTVYDGSSRCFRVGVEFSDFEADGRAIYNRFLDARLYARFGQHLITS